MLARCWGLSGLLLMKSVCTRPRFITDCCAGSTKLTAAGKKCQRDGNDQERTLPVSHRNNHCCLSLSEPVIVSRAVLYLLLSVLLQLVLIRILSYHYHRLCISLCSWCWAKVLHVLEMLFESSTPGWRYSILEGKVCKWLELFTHFCIQFSNCQAIIAKCMSLL